MNHRSPLPARAFLLCACAAAAAGLAGCGSPSSAPNLSVSRLRLGESVAYLGTTDACVSLAAVNCLRGPAAPGTFITLAQDGNGSNYRVTSADPSIAAGALVMRGPDAVGDPAIELIGKRAGKTTLTISGADNATATVPITVTTISTFTVTFDDLPTVTNLGFTVKAPAGVSCPPFEGGYSFGWSPVSPPKLTLVNFPAMGSGPLSGCVFSTVDVTAYDAAGRTLATKSLHLSIALGHDNPVTVSLP